MLILSPIAFPSIRFAHPWTRITPSEDRHHTTRRPASKHPRTCIRTSEDLHQNIWGTASEHPDLHKAIQGPASHHLVRHSSVLIVQTCSLVRNIESREDILKVHYDLFCITFSKKSNPSQQQKATPEGIKHPCRQCGYKFTFKGSLPKRSTWMSQTFLQTTRLSIYFEM